MFKSIRRSWLNGLAVVGLLLAACAPAAPTTGSQAPATATTASASTEVTTTETTTTTAAAPTGEFKPMSLAAESCDYGGEFKSIEAVDALTVKMTLCFPDPAFPSKVAFSSNGINDADYLEKTGGGGDLIEHPNGTGPYMLSEWKRGDELVLKRFDGYWGEKAKTENLIFRWSAESAQRLVELQAGTVDSIDNPGPDDFATIEGDANLQLKTRLSQNVLYMGWNRSYAPFDNEKVRQAFAMAIDKDRLVKNFYPPGSSVATQFMPPSLFGFTKEVDWYKYDPEQAKKLLTEAGVLPGFQTTLAYRDVVRGYFPNPGTIAQDIQAQLAAIGVDAKIEVMESGAFLDAAAQGQLKGLFLLGWGADYPDATNFLDVHFGPGASKSFGPGFEDIWEQLKGGATHATAEERYPFYVKANELIKEHAPMIPIAHGGNAIAYKADVEGAYASAVGAEQFALMNPGGRDTFIFMQNAEPISIYCADETDGETLRACEQVMQSLLSFAPGTGEVSPALATEWSANADLTEWTFKLRDGVKFHNGATFDANDVVTSYVAQWDAKSPLHKGRAGDFTYFTSLFTAFLNAPPAKQ
ncbi:MAG: ABC transporter substrate-binding protein [Chloroflexi bacterium]|nr:ABC transporter substrate-binding protein [Chloroflexota bacterium]